VHNNGTIIPVEEQSRLFQPFHRTRLAQASENRGWGLGLTLVKAFVEAHHGVVKVESYPKEGTIFTIDLPLDAQQVERQQAERNQPYQEEAEQQEAERQQAKPT
jgi:signal transduction histidine kinase